MNDSELSIPEDHCGWDNVFIEPDIDENDAIGIRNMFKEYLNGAGAIDWQQDML